MKAALVVIAMLGCKQSSDSHLQTRVTNYCLDMQAELASASTLALDSRSQVANPLASSDHRIRYPAIGNALQRLSFCASVRRQSPFTRTLEALQGGWMDAMDTDEPAALSAALKLGSELAAMANALELVE